MKPEFNDAKFYTCDDQAERITHLDWEEALSEYLEERCDDDDDEVGLAVIIREAPITVYAYNPQTPTDGWFENDIEYLVDTVNERWQEEYGDMAGFDADVVGPELTDAEKQVIETVLNTAWKRAVPWTCDQVAEHTFTKEELIAIFLPGAA